jgi:hypothetical protein
VRALAASAFGCAFLCLIGAATLQDPAWRWALVGGMVGLAVGLCATAGAVLGRLLGPGRRALAAGVLVGAAAALTRRALLGLIHARAMGAPPQIRPLALFAAVFTLVGGAAALLWGCAALRRASDAPAATGRLGRGLELAAAGVIVALGLYGLSPAWQAAGLRVDHWTFVGLVGLAVVSYLVEEGVARALGWRAAPPASGGEAPRRRRRRRSG